MDSQKCHNSTDQPNKTSFTVEVRRVNYEITARVGYDKDCCSANVGLKGNRNPKST